MAASRSQRCTIANERKGGVLSLPRNRTNVHHYSPRIIACQDHQSAIRSGLVPLKCHETVIFHTFSTFGLLLRRILIFYNASNETMRWGGIPTCDAEQTDNHW